MPILVKLILYINKQTVPKQIMSSEKRIIPRTQEFQTLYDIPHQHLNSHPNECLMRLGSAYDYGYNHSCLQQFPVNMTHVKRNNGMFLTKITL